MTAHWTEAYVGRPYVPGGCFLLFRDVQAAQYGRTVDFDQVTDDLRANVRAFEAGLKNYRWAAVAWPQDGDGVLMSENNAPHHVGTVVDLPAGQRILHSLKGQGVMLHTLTHIELLRFNIVGYYRPIGSPA